MLLLGLSFLSQAVMFLLKKYLPIKSILIFSSYIFSDTYVTIFYHNVLIDDTVPNDGLVF